MIRVLQIIDGDSFGGIAKQMLDIANNIKGINIDFLTQVPVFDAKITNAYNLNINRKSIKGKLIYNARLFRFLRKNKYDIVHINSAVFLYSFQVVLVSKIAGVKKIIVHSHNELKVTGIRKILMIILKPLYYLLIDKKLSCSKKAIKSLYGKDNKVEIIKNGIDINSYKFNLSIRRKYREMLNIGDIIVYGHVGRFEVQKNHDFLIDLFYLIQQKQNAVLLLVGSGSLEQEIKNKVKSLGIEKKVIFLGFRKDINNILNCMDIFLFPSVYEGLPVTLVEAQTNGLPVLVSNCVTDETKISNAYYSIDSFNKDEWLNKIMSVKSINRNNAYKNTIKYGYDIKTCAKKVQKIYEDLIK